MRTPRYVGIGCGLILTMREHPWGHICGRERKCVLYFDTRQFSDTLYQLQVGCPGHPHFCLADSKFGGSQNPFSGLGPLL